jgi:GTP pyrophosphokinase
MVKPDPEQERRLIVNHYRRLLHAWKPNRPEDRALVRKAFNFAAEAHKNMRRKSGEPYIIHPVEVARLVASEIGLGKTSIICALLHDVVEDTEYTLSDIENLFGKKVAKIIDGLTKIEDIFDKNSTSIQAENFKKMLLTLSDDVRVILIKLADRLHNMRTLDAMPQHKQLKIASETLMLYAPLAHRFGLYAIKTELEDLSLKYTEPEIYKAITEKLRETAKDRKLFINRFIYPIKKSLSRQNFNYEIFSRNKSAYSIYEKMKRKEIPLEEVYDLFAVRIIIDTEPENEKVDCWKVYSSITDTYRPNIDRLRDWISIPKANGYEALHTTVMSKDGKWVEIQIRSRRMDEIAEKGFAAHWRYKNSSPTETDTNIDRWLRRIRDMLQSNDSESLDFIDEFQGFLFVDEIYVFTPKGELRNLPVNSTVLDFAYAIHSEIGNTCIGAKVNHQLASLNHKLKSGDQVEIITSKRQIPKEEWFKYVVTGRAKTQIKYAIKEEKKKFAEEGERKFEKYLKQIDVKDGNVVAKRLQEKYNYHSRLALYYDIAKDLIGLKEIKACCAEGSKSGWFSLFTRPFTKSKPEEQKTLSEIVMKEIKDKKSDFLVGNNVHKISYDISSCCNPIPGDDIIGFVQPDEAIIIHRINCPEAISQMSKYGNRIIKTRWHDKETVGFLTGIKIGGIDKQGFINEVVKLITETHHLNIRSFHLDSNGGIVDCNILLYVYSIQNLNNVIRDLKKLPTIKKVERIAAFKHLLK